MAFVRRFVWALLTVFSYLIAFDIGGVVACLVTEALSIDFVLLSYTIWSVAGTLCGLLAYDSACRRLTRVEHGDWSTAPESGQWGLVVLSTTASALGILIGLLYRFEWNIGASQSAYVPDSMPLTLTFFIAILGSMIVGHTALRPK